MITAKSGEPSLRFQAYDAVVDAVSKTVSAYQPHSLDIPEKQLLDEIEAMSGDPLQYTLPEPRHN